MKIPTAHQRQNFELSHAKVKNLTKRETQIVYCDSDKKKSRMHLKKATVLSASQKMFSLLTFQQFID